MSGKRTIYIVSSGKTYEIGGEIILGAFTSLKTAIKKGNDYIGWDALSPEKLYFEIDASMYNDEYYTYIKKIELDESEDE